MHDLDREIYRQVVRSVDERMDCVNNSEYLVDCGDADYAIPERERMKEKLETFVETSVDRRLMEHAEAQNNFAINGGDADYTLPSQEKIKEKLENFVESTVDRRLIEHMNADREVGIDGGDSDGKEQ